MQKTFINVPPETKKLKLKSDWEKRLISIVRDFAAHTFEIFFDNVDHLLYSKRDVVFVEFELMFREAWVYKKD